MPGIEASGNIKELITARNFFARVLTRAGEFSKSIGIYQKNMKLAKDNEMEDIFLESINRLAGIYLTVGKIDRTGYQLPGKYRDLFLAMMGKLSR